MAVVKNYVWDGTTWLDAQIPIASVQNLQANLNGKQATLISGTNIKTINGNSILGAGNILLGGPKLIRERATSVNLTDVGSGNTVGSVNLTEDVAQGDTLMIELNKYGGPDYTPKYITITLGNSTNSPNTVDSDYIQSFTVYNGTNLATYSFTVRHTNNTLYFGSKKYIQGAFSGTTINWTTNTFTLYVGRVWKVN